MTLKVIKHLPTALQPLKGIIACKEKLFQDEYCRMPQGFMDLSPCTSAEQQRRNLCSNTVGYLMLGAFVSNEGLIGW